MRKKKLITIKQYADKCRVSRATVYNWITDELVTPTKTSAGMAIDLSINAIRGTRKSGRRSVASLI